MVRRASTDQANLSVFLPVRALVELAKTYLTHFWLLLHHIWSFLYRSAPCCQGLI